MICAKHTTKLLSGLLVGIALIAGVVGCGSKGGSLGTVKTTSNKAATGAASFTIQWPDRSRLIPAASNGIKITLTGGSQTIPPKTIARPASGSGNSSVNFEAVPIGKYTVTVAAYPNADATGTPQASATSVISVTANATATTQLTLASTIKSLAVNLASGHGSLNPTVRTLRFRKTEPVTLSVAAKDDTGKLVLTANKWKWTSSNPSVASVVANGGTATVTGGNLGNTTVTVTDTESNQSVSWSVNVVGAKADLITGNVAWRFPFSSFSTIRPKVGPDGTVYVLTTSALHAINPDGTQKWQRPEVDTSTRLMMDVAVSPDNTIYLLTDHAVEAYMPTGTLKWRYDIVIPSTEQNRSFNLALRPGGGVAFSLIRMPWIPGTNTFDGFHYSVVGVDANGGFLWETPVGTMDAGLGLGSDYRKVYTDGTSLYTLSGTNPQAMSALNPVDGSTRWSIPVNEDIQMSFAPDGHLYVLKAHNAVGSGSDKATYLSLLPDGTTVWEKPGFADWAWLSALFAAPNNVFYFGSSEDANGKELGRFLNAYNPDGSLKWQVPSDLRVGDIFQSSADSTVLYTWCFQYVAALDLDGKELWRIPINTQPDYVAFVETAPDHGTLYATGNMRSVDPNDNRYCLIAIQ